MKKKVSIVIPAYNEEKSIGQTLDEINNTIKKISNYDFEIIVSNNNSTDKTEVIAKEKGAKVVFQPKQGYGNAYKKGLKEASGDIIITGDADGTYPFFDIPRFLKILEENKADFINTNRFAYPEKESFSKTHIIGNKILTFLNNFFFGTKIKDSQSGMWIFKRDILKDMDFNIMSGGMPFSQEIKIYTIFLKYKFIEVPIIYRKRIGEVKLNTFKDGFDNLKKVFVFKKKLNKKYKKRRTVKK